MISLTPSRSGTHTLTSTSSPPQSVANASTNHLQDLLGGEFLYGGEGFNAALDAAQNQIQPRVQGAFNSGGRLNSGLAQTAMSQGLADAFARLYGNERSLQSNAALNLSPTTRTDNQPMYENDLLNLLGIASTGAGVADTIFGSGSTGDFLKSLFGGGGVDNSLTLPPGAGGDFDFSGAGGGIGNDSGVGLPPTPPGSGGFFDFFGGGSGSTPFNIGTDVLSQLPSGFFGSAGAPALTGSLGTAAAAELGAGLSGLGAAEAAAGLGYGGFGGLGGAAAGSAAPGGTLAGGGALAGGLGTALGAAAPVALAAYGAMSVRQKRDAQKQFLQPILDDLGANYRSGKRVTVNGVTGVPFQTPEGKTLIAAGSTANPENINNGRALASVYDPETGQYGTYSMGGFFGNNAPPASQAGMASAAAQTGFNPGDLAATAANEKAVSDYMAKQLGLGNLSYGD